MKKFTLLLAFCLISVFCFATTRQEIQIALDFIRFVNITNDLIYSAIPIAKGEAKIDIFDENNQIIGKRNMAVTEIKDNLKRVGQNIKGYKNLIHNFLDTPENKILTMNGLNSLGVNIQDMEDDILLIDNTISDIDFQNITTFEQLRQIGVNIKTTIPKLPLIRKAISVKTK